MMYFYMVQESIYKNIAIVGCGAAGGFLSVLLCKNPYNKVTAFDLKEPFVTLLPTGGGRCNLTFDEDDLKEFVKNYPRGEKFLMSVLSKIGQRKTRELFKDLGIKTYVQRDKRVFPVSDSSAKIISDLKKHLDTDNFKHIKEKVISVSDNLNEFVIQTEKSLYNFDYLVIATGGKGNGFWLAKNLGHRIIDPKPSLTALDIEEKDFYKLSGMSFKNVDASFKMGKKKYNCSGDVLFTHKSISGPCIFKISSLTAYEEISLNNPLEIELRLSDSNYEEIENIIKENSKKTVKNVFSSLVPENFITVILERNKIDSNKQAAQLKKTEKEILIHSITSLKLHVIGRIKDSEIVTAGGVDLDEVNSKTMESKILNGLYFIGEVLNIDGFTGGFNLQNCWSTAYICSMNFN